MLGLGASLAPWNPLPAQAPRAWAAGTASTVTLRSIAAGFGEDLNGHLLGGEAGVAWGPVVLRVAYAEGRLTPDSVGLERRDHAVGHALAGLRLFSGLDVTVGPQARAYLRADARERWVSWIVRAGLEAPIVAPWVRGYAVGWGVVSGAASVDGLFDRGRGGVAGLRIRPGRVIGLRLEYSIEETRLAAPLRRETIEGLGVGVCLGCD